MATGLGIAILVAIAVILSGIKVLNEYERGVVFTLGRFTGVRGPGLTLIFVPFLWIGRPCRGGPKAAQPEVRRAGH